MLKELKLRKRALAIAAGVTVFSPATCWAALEEVIVTAQKQEENIQNTPLAITAITADALTKQGITSYEGLASSTPSITVTPYAASANTLTLYMRGQGFIDPGQITSDGSVGLYEDGFYVARPQAATFDLADVERVEVLRGPQGTLYGRNTTGGAVNLISKAPKGEFGFKQSLSFGSRDLLRSLTVLDFPKLSDLATKLVLLKSNQDGYVKNSGGHDYGEQAQQAGRLLAHWDYSPQLLADYFFETGNMQDTPPYFQDSSLNGLLVHGTTPYYAKPNGLQRRTYRAIDLERSNARFEGHGLTFAYDVSSNFSIKSLTGYRKLHSDGFQDYADIYGTEFNTEDLYNQHQFSQEFEFIGSALSDQLNYVLGLYYFNESGSHENALNFPDLFYFVNRVVKAESKSKAIFGQLSWAPDALDQRVQLILGGRYTRDEKAAVRFYRDNAFGVQESGAASGAENSQKFSRFNPSFTASYQWGDDLNTYFKVATGYKAGGSAEGGPVGQFNQTFGPESLTSYELGLKSYWWDRRARLNIAAFESKIKDLQLLLGADAFNPGVFQAYNAGRATIKGLELEALVAPIDDITIQLSYSYLKPTIDSIAVQSGSVLDPSINPFSPYQVGQDVKNLFEIPYAPRQSLNLGADYAFFKFAGGSISAHLDYRWQSKVFATPGSGKDVPGREFNTLSSYGLLNGRLTLASQLPKGDNVTVSIWAKNMTHKQYQIYGGAAGPGIVALPSASDPTQPTAVGYASSSAAWGEPPSYGLDISYEY